jgi:hypothetical protein
MQAWTESAASGSTSHLGPKSLHAMETISIFIKAYMSVTSDSLMTSDFHSAFVQVYLPNMSTKAISKANVARCEFFRLMAITCRKHADWDAMGADALSHSYLLAPPDYGFPLPSLQWIFGQTVTLGSRASRLDAHGGVHLCEQTLGSRGPVFIFFGRVLVPRLCKGWLC